MSLIIFIFGTIAGSFLNVIALRWDNKNFGGRSECPECHRTLRWFELVPVLSFLIQKGKCRRCGTKISIRYPFVEIIAGFLYLSIYKLGFSIQHTLILLVVFSIYLVITLYDLKYKIIPDELVYASILLSLIVPLFIVDYAFIDWLAGPILFTFFGSIWLFSQGRAMGFGDAKLGLSVGLLLGAAHGFSGIILAFWIGAFVSVTYLLVEKLRFLKSDKGLTMKSEIPFAPFIILSAWISLIFNINLLYVVL